MSKPSVLCELGISTDNDILCSILNEICLCRRWCTTCECIKNSEGYINCTVRSENMAKQKEIKDENVLPEIVEDIILEPENDSYIEEYCLVLWKKDHAFGINFHEDGISFHTKETNYLDISLIKDIIKVKYKGEYGSPSFEIHPIYEV